MKRTITILICVFGFVSLVSCSEKQIETKKTDFTFADIKQGQEILTANDNYMNRMAPAEIAIRTGSVTADKTAQDLKQQYQANVLDWTDEEKAQINALVARQAERLDQIMSLLPQEVIFIKVNNMVEGGLPHTRANAIILPTTDEPLSETLFYHELFHVISRLHKSKHHSLYDLIGFKPCDFTPTEDVKAMSLTNPDVPAEAYYLPVTVDDKASAIMTFLHAAHPAFDPEIKGGFGGHFGFGLLKVAVNDNICTVNADENGKAQILNPGDVPDFFQAIGKNTGYIIHPEEVLADNFVFVMTGKTDLPNPEVVKKLSNWLGIK